MDSLDQIEKFTVKEFQEKFYSLISRVENGETFIITDRNKSVVVVPYTEKIEFSLDSNQFDEEEIIRIHTEHEEGC